MDYIVKTNYPTKIYRDFTIVGDVSLHIRPGSIYGLLGPSRVGKSTTMKMLLGLTKPTSSNFGITGKYFPADRIEILYSIGSLIEPPLFYTNLTGRENLEIIRRILDLSRSSADGALELVGLHEFGGYLARKYSLGIKQCLEPTGAMLGKPPTLLLDEPTNGLDPAGIYEIRNLVTSLSSRYDCTVLITSHLLAEVELVVQDTGILNHGRVLFEGNLEVLRGLTVREGLAENSLENTFLATIENDNVTHRERALP